MRRHARRPEARFDVVAARSSYVVVTCLFAPVVILLVLVAGLRPSSSLLAPIVTFLCAQAFGYVWLSRFRLVVDERRVEYRSLFTGSRTMDLANIKRAVIEHARSPFGPVVALVIYPKTETDKAIAVNLKVFRPSDVQAIVQELEGRCG
jgi:hypothetical protein